ncbi:MAG: hypothetical protein ACXWP5_11735, partial [Bdellovibrionota bacterium]
MNDLRRLAVFSLLANLAWSGCSSAPKAPAAPAAPEAATSEPSSSTSLSREQAALRSHLISHPAYILWFSLDGTKDEFEGRAVVNFELKPKARDFSRNLLLDFEEGTVRS